MRWGSLVRRGVRGEVRRRGDKAVRREVREVREERGERERERTERQLSER